MLPIWLSYTFCTDWISTQYFPLNFNLIHKPYQAKLHKIYTMCFGSSKTHDDPYWWGYIDDGQGWTARPKSEYMKTPEYNPELRRQLKKERKERKQEAKEVEKKMRKGWLEGSRVSKVTG